MAVTLETFEDEYTGDGTTTVFPITFGFNKAEHVRVSVTVDDEETWLTQGSDFTVDGEGEGEGEGSVTFATAPASGVAIRIVRLVPITQLIARRTQGPFSPEEWERATDLLTHICQQINGGAIDIEDVFPGEVNGGQNVGTGVGVYEGKSGVTLQFRGIKAGDNITVTHDDANNDIVIEAAGADLASTPPAILVAGGGAITGTALTAARADHRHALQAGGVQTIGTANSAGTASSVARSDHVHAHGDQTSGSLHAVATGTTNGFMSSEDKKILDRVRTVTARGHYDWNGTGYDLNAGATYDPAEILPTSVSSTSGVATLTWRRQLDRVPNIVSNCSRTEETGAHAFVVVNSKSDTEAELIFVPLTGTPEDVTFFDVYVDMAVEPA